MSKREPGHIPQTSEGSDLLGFKRPPSRWAVRLGMLSAAVALVALALLIGSLAPGRHAALRERPEVHTGDQGLPRIQPGARAGG